MKSQQNHADIPGYIRKQGVRCPFCKSSSIEGESFDFDTAPSQDVACLDCGAYWRDFYTLTDVIIHNGPHAAKGKV